jgi:molybdenum cofactor cytidylyltransferase
MCRVLNIAVIIPAAGSSSRLGKPKQLLKWKKNTLLGHAIATVNELKNIELYVVLGANLESIQKEIKQYKTNILHNRNWKNGLGSSIAVGAQKLLDEPQKIDAVLIHLADQPLISSLYLKALIEKFQKDKNQIIATSYGEDKYGVPAIFDKSYLRELSKLDDDKGAKKLIANNQKQVSSVGIQPILSDIDTPDDYAHLLKK